MKIVSVEKAKAKGLVITLPNVIAIHIPGDEV